MSRKPASARHNDRTPAGTPTAAGNDLLLVMLKMLVAALIAARWLTPTEATPDGDTLWIVQLWLGAGLLWVWRCYREGDYRIRVDWLDLFLWIVVAGHVASAVSVIVEGGQKRAAVNMLWEWVGLGAMFYLARQVFQTSLDRQRMMLSVVAIAACLAALGVWQHYVFYPQTARAYEAMRNELDALQTEGPAKTPDEAMRRQQQVRQLTGRMAEQGIPLEGTSRLLWESRLRASSEPFGLFALANSFAGLLIVGLMLATGFGILVCRLGGGPLRVAASCAVIILILYCVVLTKSRTAWCGLAVGGAAWMALSQRQKVQTAGRQSRWVVLGGVLTIFAVFAFAGLSGGFDWKVVSEASKSLSYRTQYWRGTWNMLAENPIFGAGPGNFRQLYLKHKLPESSEEIADPHNMLLDLWSSGGLLALAGFAGFIACAFRLVTAANEVGEAGHPLSHPVVIGTAAGFALIWCGSWLLGDINPADDRFIEIPLMLVGYLVLVALLGRTTKNQMASTACVGAAAISLLVHLLGSGGIEMPAITQILLLLAALSREPVARMSKSSQQIPTPASARGVVVIAAVALVLFFACLSTATAPATQSKALLASGEDAQRRGNLQQAESLYRKASECDPFSPKPIEKLARLWFDRWLVTRQAGDDSFKKAVELQELAIRLDPHNWLGFETLGQWHQALFSQTKDAQDARKTADYLAQAADRYPASAALQAEFAEALDSAGDKDKAGKHAKIAIDLDSVNHQAGHSDKYLSESVLQRLDRLQRGG